MAETVTGEVVRHFKLPHRDSDFARDVFNKIELTGLHGGTYTVVKVSDEPADGSRGEIIKHHPPG